MKTSRQMHEPFALKTASAPLQGTNACASPPRSTFASLPREIIENVFSRAVEDHFLPGVCAASHSMRRLGIEYAATIVSKKHSRQLQQATSSWRPGQATVGARPPSGHDHYVEGRATAYLARLRRHSAYAEVEHARDLAESPLADPYAFSDYDERQVLLRDIDSVLQHAIELASNDAEVRCAAAQVYLDLMNKHLFAAIGMQDCRGAMPHALSVLSLVPGQAQALACAVQFLANELTLTHVEDIESDEDFHRPLSSFEFEGLYEQLTQRIREQTADAATKFVLAVFQVDSASPESEDFELGKAQLESFVATESSAGPMAHQVRGGLAILTILYLREQQFERAADAFVRLHASIKARGCSLEWMTVHLKRDLENDDRRLYRDLITAESRFTAEEKNDLFAALDRAGI